MAKQQSAADKRGADARARFNSSKYGDVKFINRELTADEKKTLKDATFTEIDAFLSLEKWSEEYKFTLKWDERGACYSCFMQPIASEHINAKLILTGRGSTMLKALKQTLFKHEVLAFEYDWGTLDGSAHADLDD